MLADFLCPSCRLCILCTSHTLLYITYLVSAAAIGYLLTKTAATIESETPQGQNRSCHGNFVDGATLASKQGKVPSYGLLAINDYYLAPAGPKSLVRHHIPCAQYHQMPSYTMCSALLSLSLSLCVCVCVCWRRSGVNTSEPRSCSGCAV